VKDFVSHEFPFSKIAHRVSPGLGSPIGIHEYSETGVLSVMARCSMRLNLCVKSYDQALGQCINISVCVPY
jgi:hypothetical protein